MSFAPSRANKLQLGRQSSLSAIAAATAATTIWRGEGATDIVDARKDVRVAENIGLAGNTDRLYTASELGRLAMAPTPFTFQEAPHVFEGGIKAATPGAATAYLRTYDLPQANTPNTIKYYSLEAGNAVIGGDAHVLPGAFVEDFELAGEAGPDGGAWMITANWVGQRKTLQAFTAALSAPTVEEAIFNKTKIYIDASAGTIGTSLQSNVLVKASIKVKTGWVAVPTADGTLYYTAVKYVVPDDQVTFDITFELEDVEGTVIAERAFYVSHAIRLIRLVCPGSTANFDLQIDMAVRYSEFSTYENTNGNVTVTVTGYALISTVDAKYFTIAVKNGIAALPVSYFVQPTVTIVLNPDDDPAQQNSVVLRKWTGEERQRIMSLAMTPMNVTETRQVVRNGGEPDVMVDWLRYSLEMVKVCITSWSGPDFDGRPATPANVALLPPDIIDPLARAAHRLNAGITEEEKKAFDLPMNGQLSTTSPGPSPDGTPATSPS